MSAGTASLCYNFLFFSVFVFVSAGQKTITAESGQDVTLTCRTPNNNITAVHWSRADLRDKYVLLYQDKQFDPDDQHPSFKNRVDLQDRQMKDGDVSLILKDVTINDAARYKCHVLVNETESWKLVSIINLRVSPGQKNITAESGQDVTLTCRAPNNNIKSVHWSRADLTDEYVLFYQKGQFVPDNQHPSFKNRVDLQDRQMKDGDVSLILKDVMINDTGTYMCRVFIGETRSWKNSIIIYLHVVPPGQKNITAESGQDVTLTCRAPYNNIKSVEWSRDDLTSGFVYLYQDGHFVPDNQHPSFKNRVDLQDRQMKDGDVSVILKNVTINDTGTYECGVQRVGGPMTLISITNLTVVDPPAQTGGVRVDEGKKEEGKKDEVKNEGGKKEEGEKDEGKKEEGKKHEVKNEGGKKEEGKKEEGKKEEGKKEEGKKDEGKKEEGKKDEGKKEEGKKEEGKKEEGKKEEGKKHEVKNEGGKKEEAKKEEGKKEEGKKEEGKKEEGKKEEGKKEEGKKEEGEKDESIALQVLPLLLVAAVSVFFSHLKNKTKKNKKKTEAESKKVKGSAHLVSLLLQSQLTAGFPNMEKRALLSNPETSPSY